MKEKKTMATPNKSSWTILISAFGTRKEKFDPISTTSKVLETLSEGDAVTVL